MTTNKKLSEVKKGISSFAKEITVIAVIILLIIAAGALHQSLQADNTPIPSSKLAKLKIQEPIDASSTIGGKYYGLCPKNSVHSVEDFRKTVENDPTLAKHFSEFNWDNATIGKQESDVWTFVSYRKDNIIKRTSRAVKLPKGDSYITDGRHVVRTFCCNDYVIAPPPPGAPPVVERIDAPPPRPIQETPEQVFSTSDMVAPPSSAPTDAVAVAGTPATRSGLPAGYPTYPPNPGNPSPGPGAGPSEDDPGASNPEPPPVLPNISTTEPPVFPNTSTTPGEPPPGPPTEPPIPAVPEPGTLLLVGAGATMFALFSRFRKKR